MKKFQSLLAISAIFTAASALAADPVPGVPVVTPEKPDFFTAADRGGPNNLKPGVIGETYMGLAVTQTISDDKCKDLVDAMKDKLNSPSFASKQFSYDYVYVCQEVEKGIKVLMASMIVEPSTTADTEALSAFREKVSAEDVLGLTLNFKKMKGIEIEKHLLGMYIPDLENPKPAHRFELVSTKIESFPNLHQFRMHLLTEKMRMYYAKDLKTLKAYLATYLVPSEMKIFEDNALRKSNIIMIMNNRRNVFMDNQKMEALSSDSNYSLCTNFGSKFCMME